MEAAIRKAGKGVVATREAAIKEGATEVVALLLRVAVLRRPRAKAPAGLPHRVMASRANRGFWPTRPNSTLIRTALSRALR